MFCQPRKGHFANGQPTNRTALSSEQALASEKPGQGEAAEPSLAQAVTRGRRSVLGSLAIAAGLTVAPHVACILGAAGVVGGGYSLYSWCRHGAAEPVTLPNLPRLAAVPSNYREFRPEESAQAAEILVRNHPEFRSVVAFKQAESPGQKVGLTFLEDRESGVVSVIVCREGALCPCEKPQLFAVGHREAAYRCGDSEGSQAVIAALYAGNRASPESEPR